MYRGLSMLAMTPVLTEQTKLGEVIRRAMQSVADEVLVIDDGSTDRFVQHSWDRRPTDGSG